MSRRLKRLESMIEIRDTPTEFDTHTINFVAPDMTVTSSMTLQIPRPPRRLSSRAAQARTLTIGRIR